MSETASFPPFSKKIAYSYNSVMTAKIRNFYKRSFWKYTASAALYAAGIRLIRKKEIAAPETIWIFVNFFLIVMSIFFILIVVSSLITARKYGDKHMVYTFSAEGIRIVNEINGMEEDHPWDWIRSVEEGRKALYLRIDARKYFELILEKSKMSPEEIEAVKLWQKAAR